MNLELVDRASELLINIRRTAPPKANHVKIFPPKGSSPVVKLLVEHLQFQATINCPEQSLAFAVLCDAIFDLVRKPRFEGDRRRIKAINWFYGGYHVGWCELLRLNSVWLIVVLVRAGLLTDRGKVN